MLGAGTVINPIIKIVTTVAILAAAYFFIVKPILDTTESAFDSVSPAFESFQGFEGLPGQIQDQVDQAFDQTNDSERLAACIQRALRGGAPGHRRINRCVDRFSG
ncbi:MAG: hypothetical protein GEU88_01825 [Solirubrobacterales bacterium]|nr:hypothetical protein [Solirubrobacterales bacterium]